jgi:hypothetical protein
VLCWSWCLLAYSHHSHAHSQLSGSRLRPHVHVLPGSPSSGARLTRDGRGWDIWCKWGWVMQQQCGRGGGGSGGMVGASQVCVGRAVGGAGGGQPHGDGHMVQPRTVRLRAQLGGALPQGGHYKVSPLFSSSPFPASSSSCTSFTTEVVLARRVAKPNSQFIRPFVFKHHAPHSESSEGRRRSLQTVNSRPALPLTSRSIPSSYAQLPGGRHGRQRAGRTSERWSARLRHAGARGGSTGAQVGGALTIPPHFALPFGSRAR